MHLDKGKQNILRTFKFSKYGIVKIKQEYTLELRGYFNINMFSPPNVGIVAHSTEEAIFFPRRNWSLNES